MSFNNSNQDVRREERERNQRERQQVSRHSQQRHEESVSAPLQVSASLLFDTPIKKEKPDETSKMIEKTLGDFNQVSKYLMSSDHKQIIGISTHEIQRKHKMEGDKARIEQILKEMKGLPPITGLDDFDHDTTNGSLDYNPKSNNSLHHFSNDRNHHFLDERSSSGVSDDESSRSHNLNSNSHESHQQEQQHQNHHKSSKSDRNRFAQSHDWTSKRLNEAVNQGSDNEPLLKRSRKTSESILHLSSRHRHHQQRNNLNGKIDRSIMSPSASSSSSDSDSDSDSSSSSSSDNESIADVASNHNMSGVEDGADEMDVIKTFDSLQGSDGRHAVISSSFPASNTAEVDNPVGSWNLMSFMHKDPSKNAETSSSPSRRDEDEEPGGEESRERLCETADDKYTKTINNVAVGLQSSPLLSSPSSSSPDPHDGPLEVSSSKKDSGVKLRKTNNSLSAPLHASIISDVVNKSSKQSKVNEVKEKREPTTDSSSRNSIKSSTPMKTNSPPRLTARDCGPGNNILKLDSSGKSKRPTPRKVSPSKQSVPSKENHRPLVAVKSESKKDNKSIPEIVPKQLICSIDCQMLKRIPKGLNVKKEQSNSVVKKEKDDVSKKDSSNGNCLSTPSASQKVSHKPAIFSPNDRKSQQKNDVSSPRRVPSSATKKDPSSSPSPPPPRPPPLSTSSPLTAATSTLLPPPPLTSATSNRSQQPSQSGPCLPVSGSIIPHSLSSGSLSSTNESNNHENSVDKCLANAKKLKHAADGESERTAKFCKYIESFLHFVLTGHEQESRSYNINDIIAMYSGTLKMLQHTTENFRKGCSPTSASDHKLLALGHRCLSVINSKIYQLKAKEVMQNSRMIKDIKSNKCEDKPGDVYIPASTFACMRKQLDFYKILDTAFRNWVEVDIICQKHPPCKAFIDTLDKECIPLSITSNVENLVSYVRTGLNLLR